VSDNNQVVSDQEVDQWISELTEADKAELRRQQLVSRAISKAEPKPSPNFSGMSDADLHRYTRENFGF
jgi:hypothetical protein